MDGSGRTEPGSSVVRAVRSAIDSAAAFEDLLGRADKDYLLDCAVVRSASPGRVLCRRHRRDDRVFIIVVGEVEVTETVDGQTTSLAHLGATSCSARLPYYSIPRASRR